jgi:excisionase family DNA binding protein
MYVNVSELAKYLGVTDEYILEQIRLGHVKAVFDGTTYLLNKKQFTWHKEQLELKRKQHAEEQEEPLPEDWDAKDED